MVIKKKSSKIQKKIVKVARKKATLTKSVRITTSLKGKAVKPLKVSESYGFCKKTIFKFKSTSSLKKSQRIISQERAIKAIEIGLGIKKPGYNIYVAGIQGTGKSSVIKGFLQKKAAKTSSPPDWVYVHNFSSVEEPITLKFNAGEGVKFKKKINNFIKSLREIIPMALESEDYEMAISTYITTSNENKNKMYSALEKLAKKQGFIIKSNRTGIETIPVIDGRQVSEKDYNKLNEKERKKIEDKRTKLEPKILEFARNIRLIEQETSGYVEVVQTQLGEKIVGGEIAAILKDYKHESAVISYLENLKSNIIENLLDFIEHVPTEEDDFTMRVENNLTKYCVNLFVDNSNQKNVPVVMEHNPTFFNVFGYIEKNINNGMYLTDFMKIKPGAIHRANGGYLVLEASDVFSTPNMWETLKRVLKNRKGFLDDINEQQSMFPVSGLRPIPIPLDVKVVLIGNDEIYHMALEGDDEFKKIFKIKADFDSKMIRNDKTMLSYASFIATICEKESLLHFTPDGVCTLVEYGSRLIDNQNYLSTQFGELKNIIIEADYFARSSNKKMVSRDSIEKAIYEKHYRVNLYENQLDEMLLNDDILLSVDGHNIGQVNALTVYDLNDHSFGRVCRITCNANFSDDGITNIERESKLSGKLHTKGMHILTSYLNRTLWFEKTQGFSANVCFEQSYGYIDGDSATIAEVLAIVSALSGVPIDQSFSVTGSMNQFGDVQAIGGVNEKVEGFFNTCKRIGKKKKYNVMIPYQNVINLMLNKETREAVKSGFLKIYPIKHISEAFYLSTGVEFGVGNLNSANLVVAKDSAIFKIRERMAEVSSILENIE